MHGGNVKLYRMLSLLVSTERSCDLFIIYRQIKSQTRIVCGVPSLP
jgi:hypothetical protein